MSETMTGPKRRSITDPKEIILYLLPYLEDGRLSALPAKKRKRLTALFWLSEHIPHEKTYTEEEFSELLNRLHSFGDPALLRRELCDYGLIERSADGTAYRPVPARPSLEALLIRYCGGTVAGEADGTGPAASADVGDAGDAPREAAPFIRGKYEDPCSELLQDRAGLPERSSQNLEAAAEFRDIIHAQALAIVQRIRPEVRLVIDRYAVQEYFQEHWDYPGRWYTITAVPESAGGRKALIHTIVMDTLAKHR